MKNPPFFLLALVLSLTSGAIRAQALPATGPNVLSVTQTVSTSSSGLVSSLEVRLGRPGTIGSAGAAATALASTGRNGPGAGIEGLPAIDLGTGALDLSQIETAFAARLAPLLPTLDRQLAAGVARSGADLAVFRLEQRVEPRDAGTGPTVGAATLSWARLVRPGETAQSPAPRVRLDAPRALHVSYTPLAVEDDLPSGTQYDGAGDLSWSLLDAAMLPLGPPTRIATRGAFDEPASGAGAVDPDAGLRCLIDGRNAGCAPFPTDVRTLLSSTGARLAVLDYRRRLTALRKPVADADGSTTWDAQIAVDVQRRSLSGSACGGGELSYRNDGVRGYSVLALSDRYLVVGGDPPQWSALGRSSEAEIVEAEPYSKQVPIARSAALALGDLLIDPLGESLDLVPASSVAGLEHLAALEEAPLQVDVLLARRTRFLPLLAPDSGDPPEAPWWSNTVRCLADGRLQYEAVAQGEGTLRGPGPGINPEDATDSGFRFFRTIDWTAYLALCSRISC